MALPAMVSGQSVDFCRVGDAVATSGTPVVLNGRMQASKELLLALQPLPWQQLLWMLGIALDVLMGHIGKDGAAT